MYHLRDLKRGITWSKCMSESSNLIKCLRYICLINNCIKFKCYSILYSIKPFTQDANTDTKSHTDKRDL